MRFTKTPAAFPVAYWRGLWENNINDLEKLRELASTRGVVAIDLDPYISHGKTSHEGITEFGISFLPPIASSPLPTIPSPASLAALIERFSIQSSSIRVADRQRPERHREIYSYGSGESQIIPADQVEDSVLSIINSFSSSLDPRPILVGFGLGYELKILARLYPRLLTECFSTWSDIQEIALDISTLIHRRPVALKNKESYWPGMSDTLFALGYTRDGASIGGLKQRHNAGNDAVRVLAVLLGFLVLPQPPNPTLDPLLRIHKDDNYSSNEMTDCVDGLVSRKYWKSKPEPPELFPYMARFESQGTPLPTRFRAKALYKHFAKYEPLVAGISAPESGEKYYYLCLSTAESLEKFLAEVDGLENPKGGF